MEKYDLLLFDLDGTLTDSKLGIVNSVKYALEKLGLDALNDNDLVKFVGPPLRNSFKEFCGMDDAGAEDAVAKYREYYFDKGMFENLVYSGVADMLGELAKQGTTLAVATSKPEILAVQILKHFGLEHYFSLIVGSEMDGARSDKAEIITAVRDVLDKDRNKRVVMIGDRKHDILGAKACDVDSVGVLWGYGGLEELQAAGADSIVSTPRELLKTLNHE